MEIAVYGDSFGDSHHSFKSLTNEQKQKLSFVKDSWVEILAKKYSVTNYCKYSSSFEWSVNNFVKTHTNYDKIIMLVTSPDRITMGNPHNKQPTPHMVDYKNSVLWKERAKKEGWNKHLDAVLDYYIYVYNEELVDLKHKALLEYVKQLRPDTILIPCFDHSFEHPGANLNDVYQFENRHMNIQTPILKRDIRKCHLTNENNAILAKIVERSIHGEDFFMDLNDFCIPKDSKEKYLHKDLPYE